MVKRNQIGSKRETNGKSCIDQLAGNPFFQELIDLIAMKRGLDGSDDYLLHWRRETMADREGDVKEIAEAVASDIEANYASVRAEALANTG